MSFIIDNLAYVLAAACIYVGGCYTPRTYDAIKASVLDQLARRFK
jgi:hypothetical protein